MYTKCGTVTYLTLTILHNVNGAEVVEDVVLVDGILDRVQSDRPFHLLALQRALERSLVLLVVLVQDLLHL